MRELTLLQRTESFLAGYSFEEPFSIYLKRLFRAHPEMGSRDRREVRELCYSFFRLGRALPDLTFSERLAIAAYLCNADGKTSAYAVKQPLGQLSMQERLEDRIEHISSMFPTFRLDKLFPDLESLSPELEEERWCMSMLRKPRTWIRIRKGKQEEVLYEFEKLNLTYTIGNEHIVSFGAEINLDQTESFQKGLFEVQDLNSQKTLSYLAPKKDETWWDACAGSGGKSLLLLEEEPAVHIVATDIRDQTLKNYASRLKKAGHRNFKTVQHDLTRNSGTDQMFDGIIADVPCSGSGTWSRTPEWLCHPSSDLSGKYVDIQRKIMTNLVNNLKQNAPIVYITCSVYKTENEENIRYFTEKLPLKLEKSDYLKGFETGADTLFAARLIRTF